MKSYKDYYKTYIGGSDSARLTLKTSDGATESLYFGKDGDYSAYIVNEYTPVPEHYHKRYVLCRWSSASYSNEKIS